MKHQRQGGFLIAKIHQLSGRIFTKKLKEHDIEINPAQGRVLFPLWRKDRIAINELVKETALGKSTLTTMLDRLERAGYLKRLHSETDRRNVIIELTEKNFRLKNEYNSVSTEMNELFYAGFSEKEVDQFEKYLLRILSNLMDNLR
ncbi:MAG: MarR family winged helix-turn-helix transcriptional regulator [Candidatus Hodarchaeales archaeon]